MARAGMTRWRSRNCAPVTDGCDEVQKSLDLLDKVLSEFDDFDSTNLDSSDRPTYLTSVTSNAEEVASLKSCSTPEDESPSGLGGHQSEDDGYMSMNGRKAKLLLSTSPSNDFKETNGTKEIVSSRMPSSLIVRQMAKVRNQRADDFPPPPEEAERIISSLLPRVSPCSSSHRNQKCSKTYLNRVYLDFEKNTKNSDNVEGSVTIATQTTLPKTKHQRPYGWQNESHRVYNHANHFAVNGDDDVGVTKSYSKYGSLPYDGVSYRDNCPPPPWLQRFGNQIIPLRSVPSVLDRHREVRRCMIETEEQPVLNTVQEIIDEDPTNFSDDSLEDVPPPPLLSADDILSMNKRSSIAWEVSLESDNDAFLVPGSTKVVGRRRQKSADHSNDGSLTTLNLNDDWPDPPYHTDDSLSCLTSDTDLENAVTDRCSPLEQLKRINFNGGTYVIRKGNKKDRIYLSDMKTLTESCLQNGNNSNAETNLKRYSSTFDNIKTLLKEGLIEGLDDSPPDFHPPRPPGLARGVSLPSILNDDAFEESKTSFIDKDTNESESSVEQLLLQCNNRTEDNGNRVTSIAAVDCTDSSVSAVPRLVSKCIWTEDDRIDVNNSADNCVEKQSVAVQVSADFTLLNKEIAEQSISCQTDNEELNYCVHKAVNTAENITSTSTFKKDKKSKPTATTSTTTTTEKLKDVTYMSDDAANEKNIDEVKYVNVTSISTTKNSSSNATNTKKNQPVAEYAGKVAEKKKELKLEIARQERTEETWTQAIAIPEIQKVPVAETKLCNGTADRTTFGDFRVNVEVLHHEFGPLPPSPVEEVDDEYSDVLHSVPPVINRKSDSLNKDMMYFRSSRSSISGSIKSNRAPDVPHHRDQNSSLKTRSVDAGFIRNQRSQFLKSRKEVPVERRTLPTELPGTSHRRPLLKRSSQSSKEENGHVSCSLPETPIFARGCDIPRTPLRSCAEKNKNTLTNSRLNNGIQTPVYARNVGAGHGTCLGEAMAGAELLRLTGPGRGWYPRHRQSRPASVEHLDRLAPQGLSPTAPSTSAWDGREVKKPLTLPPNLSPKFFQRSPREALRRVTSLLIRKGGGGKETKSKDVLASSVIGPHGDFGEAPRQQKRGFFRSFWKRSRHYSLDQQ